MRSLLSIFSFRGRARRTFYGLFVLVTIGIGFGIALPFDLLIIKLDPDHVFTKAATPDPNAAAFFAWVRAVPIEIAYVAAALSALVVLVFYVAWIAACVRRLHDMNATGWIVIVFILIALVVPIFGYLLVSLLLALWPGTKGPNRYGADPRRLIPVADVFGNGPTTSSSPL